MNYIDITKELASKEPAELELRQPTATYAVGSRVGGNDWGPGVGKSNQTAERRESAAVYGLNDDNDDDLDIYADFDLDAEPKGETVAEVIERMMIDPEYAEEKAAEFESMFEESRADIAAGRTYTNEEVYNDIMRKIRTGQWDD
jgi:predicted transcriptional regulator